MATHPKEGQKVAAIVGATGLVGSSLLSFLLNSPRYQKVLAISRRPLEIQHERLENLVVDFRSLSSISDQIVADEVFSALGSTLRKAGSKEAFREIDLHYNLEVARAAVKNGASKLLIVSSLGASSQSRLFYLKVKGELEDALSRLPYEAIHFFQPSLLVGERKESRPLEVWAMKASLALKPWLVGPIRKLQPIEGKAVAQAMVLVAQTPDRGVIRHRSEEIQRIYDWANVG